MKNTEQLINNVVGQLNGVKKMIDDKKDCASVLIQFKASKSALESVIARYIKENLSTCLKDSVKQKDKKRIESLILESVKNN